MKYFAYGSNMSSDEIISWLGNKPETSDVLKLIDYKFSYNKKSKDGTGKANVQPSKNINVYGVTYELTEEQMIQMDKKEGGYKRINITLYLDNKKIKAVTYTAKNERIDSTLKPKEDYRNKIIKGAIENKLPKSYIKQYIEN